MKKVLLILALFMAVAVNAQSLPGSHNLAVGPVEKKELIKWLKGDTTLQSNWNITPEDFMNEFWLNVNRTGSFKSEVQTKQEIIRFIKYKLKVVKYESSDDVYLISQTNSRYSPYCLIYINDRVDPGNILCYKTKQGFKLFFSLQTGNFIGDYL